jgi:hypothetical protein
VSRGTKTKDKELRDKGPKEMKLTDKKQNTRGLINLNPKGRIGKQKHKTRKPENGRTQIQRNGSGTEGQQQKNREPKTRIQRKGMGN